MNRWLVLILYMTSVAAAQVVEVPPAAMQTLAPETPEAFAARMKWWREARFGMFIHWGLYAIPAGEWKGQKTKGAGEWIMHDLKIPPGEYRAELLGKFNPVKFDAVQWASIARNAGMKYIVITSKHHDGFALYDSKFSDFDVMSTPFKRDILRELADATRAAGLQICWYHSILDWSEPDGENEQTFGKYEWRMRAQVNELLARYGDIGVMWFDGEWIKPWNDDRGKNLYTLCRTLQPKTIVNNRVGKHRAGMGGFTKTGGFSGDYATPEQRIPTTVPAGLDWETCMTMNDTWGFKRQDTNWKSTQTLIRQLIEIASKNGNFLLNVGPTAEGEIPQASIERLRAIGNWLDINGEAINETSGSPFEFALPFGRCTQKPGKLYLHVMQWPDDGKITVPIRNAAKNAMLLAPPNPSLTIEQTPAGVVIQLPPEAPDPDATVVSLQIDGTPDVIPPPSTQPAPTQPATAPAPITQPAIPPATTTTAPVIP